MSTTYVNTIDSLPLYADRAEKDAAGNTITTTYATKSDVTTGLASKEDSANKAQSINTSSTTDFPSSKATADFVNSSVATNTAKFLGNFTLTDLSLTYPATDAQIETALDGYTFSPAPTNNDYVYVEIQDPQTPGVTDVVKRFKFDGSNWLYEYSLNNSSFTAAEIASIDSGVTSTKVGNYDTHIADTDIHVTLSDKSTWNGKQDAISDLATIRSGAALGATALQDMEVSRVALTGLYADLLNKPDLSVYAESADLATVATTGAYSDLVGTPTIRNVPPVTSSDDNKVLKASYTGGVGSYSWEQESGGGSVTDVEVDGTSVVNASGVAEITMPTVPALKALTAGNNITITEGANSVTIAAASSTQVNADWDAVSGVAEILNKPSIPSVDQTYDSTSSNAQSGIAMAGALANKQDTISDLATIRSGAAAGATALQDMDVSRVALTGLYSDLIGTPTIPSGTQLVPAATSADEDKVLTVDSQGTPGWASAQAPISAGDGIDITSNVVSAKVDGTTIDTNSSGELTVIGGGGGGTQADWTEDDPTDPSYIENKPTPKTLTAGTGISITENQSTITIAATGGSGVTDVEVDGTSVVSGGVASITMPTVDQTYDASSTNAQSGTAVASAVAAIGTWTDVTSEITASQTIITSGSMAFRYNAALRLISIIGEIHVQGDGLVYTLPAKYRPQSNFTVSNPGATSYIDYNASTGNFTARSGANGYFSWTMTMPCLGE